MLRDRAIIFFRQKLIWDLIIAFLIIFLGYIYISFYYLKPTPDMERYLCNAFNLFTGKGYTNFDGKPIIGRPFLFPFLIAISYKLNGVSVWSAYKLISIFFVLTPVAVFFLGKSLFSYSVGIFSALSILFSAAYFNITTVNGIDVSIVFFLLCFLLCYRHYQISGNIILFVLSPILLGIAYLIKEVAILFLLFPLIINFFTSPGSGYKIFSKKIIVFYVIFFVTISPWLIYLIINGKLLYMIGAPAKEIFLSSSGVEAMDHKNWWIFLGQIIKTHIIFPFSSFYSRTSDDFCLAPLFLISWIYCLYKSVVSKNNYRFLSVSFLCFLPVVYLFGKHHLRPGQILFVYCLSYLMMWCAILDLAHTAIRFLAREKHGYLRFKVLQIACCVIIMVLVSVYQLNSGSWFFYKNSCMALKFTNSSGYPCKKRIRGIIGNKESQELSQWLTGNIEKGTRVVIFERGEYPYYFLTNGMYDIERFPGAPRTIKNNKSLDPAAIYQFITEVKDKNISRSVVIVPAEYTKLKEIISGNQEKFELIKVVNSKYAVFDLKL